DIDTGGQGHGKRGGGQGKQGCLHAGTVTAAHRRRNCTQPYSASSSASADSSCLRNSACCCPSAATFAPSAYTAGSASSRSTEAISRSISATRASALPSLCGL